MLNLLDILIEKHREKVIVGATMFYWLALVSFANIQKAPFINLIIGLLCAVLVLWALSKREDIDNFISVFKKSDTYIFVGKCLFLYYGINWTVNAILLNLFKNELPPLKNQEMVTDLKTAIPVLTWYAYVLLFAPLFEELLFRDLLIGKLFKSYPLIGCFVSWFAFTLLHLVVFNWYSFLIYGFLSFIITLVYYIKRDVRYSFLAHLSINLLSVFIMLMFGR